MKAPTSAAAEICAGYLKAFYSHQRRGLGLIRIELDCAAGRKAGRMIPSCLCFAVAIAAILTGCAAATAVSPQAASQPESTMNLSARFSETYKLSPDAGGSETNIKAACASPNISIHPQSDDIHELPDIFDSASAEMRKETHCADAFMRHGIIHYLKTGERIPGLSLETADPDSLKALGQGAWFFSDLRGFEWCRESLCLRKDGVIVDYGAALDQSCEHWMPMNLESFSEWYGLLNERLHLDDQFAEGDRARMP